MCGIVGYIGREKAPDILIEGLHRLEYRGYDSAGIAVPTGDGALEVIRREGKVEELERACAARELPATMGIGHTRWATHGRPSETNAHPHIDCEGKIAIVHNGIIENYVQLRDELKAEGHTFRSETDTEIVAHLLEKYYDGDLVAAMAKTVTRLEGAYGIAAIHVDHPDQIVVTRKDSPIVVGYAAEQQASLLASDIVAVMNYTRDVIFLEDGQIAKLTREGITFVVTNTKKPDRTDTPDTPVKPSNPSKPSSPAKPTLPQTGAVWWHVEALALSGLVFLILGALDRKTEA